MRLVMDGTQGENPSRMREGEIIAGRFAIEAHAGTGGMGAVYRARDRVRDATVAVKVIVEEGSQSRFDQEARVLAGLDHPAIVRYVAHGRTDDGAPFLAMEWLAGEDLRARLLRGPLSIADALAVARRIAEALAYAHARGVVHRDIKPGNLLLPASDPARVTVLDFGIARTTIARALDSTAAPITRTGMVVGTVGYMSPEQARGANDVDARADVFALGCVLFECITGRPAFVGANPVAVLAKLLLEEAPRARYYEATTPPALDDLIARMLAKDPAARPRDAAAVLRALDSTEGARVSSSSGAYDREQRMVTIVLAKGLDRDAARPLIDAEMLELADGATLIEFRGTDPATAAAASAIALHRAQPGVQLAIATGRVASANAYGPIIDRVATLKARRGIPIDDISATLLGDRFEIVDGSLLGPARASSAPRTLLGRATPCVGRDKEIALLEATLRECIAEPIARCVLVTAPAGSGKTRLSHELLARASANVLIARGDPVGAGSALGIARQLVRHAARLRESDPIEGQHKALRDHLEQYFSGDALARVSEMLGELVGAPSPTPSPNLRAARDDARILASWLSRIFAEWIAALCDAAPLLCVIEDLHWGDGASVAYLDDALRANAMRPLMVLALSRPEVHDLFPGLWSRAEVQEIKLPALTKRAAERLIKSVLGDLDADTTARLIERSDGNAFHLEELIRHVAERGVESLPETVLALAEARIARLEPDARRYLRVASVFGETFSEDGVLALLGDGAPPAATRLVENEVVVATAGQKFSREYQFRHGLLRDAAYAMLADEDRAALHLAAGTWLERAGEKEALVLAEHYERAGDRARAAPCFLRASRQAGESWNIAATRDLAMRGLRCGVTGELRGQLLLAEAMAHVASNAHGPAARSAKEAYGLLPRRSADWYTAGAYALSSGAYVGDNELAPTVIQDLLTTEIEGRATGAYGYAIATAVDILDSIGQHEASDRLMGRANALATADDADPAFRAYVIYGRTAMSLRRDCALGDQLTGVQAGAAAAAQIQDAIALSLYKFGSGILYAESGDTTRARTLYQQTLASIGDAPLFAAWTSIHLAWCDIVDGRYADAVTWARKAYEVDPHHAYALAAHACLLSGEQTEAERLSARSLQGIDDSLVTPFVVAVARAIGARIALAARDLPRAEALSQRASSWSGGPPYMRSFVDRTRIDVLRAHGAPVNALLDAFVERIERHRASLPGDLAATYVRLPDHAHILELAQR